MSIFSFIKKLFKANISVVSADKYRFKIEEEYIVEEISESTRDQWMRERHEKDNVSSLINYDGFHEKFYGRDGMIYYVKEKQLCEIYCEMTFADEYDWIISLDQLCEWVLPAKKKMNVPEKENIKEELLVWLKKKRISAEVTV